MNIGTWNVQSWYRPGAAINAVEQMENIGMDITAVQEIRWPDDGNIKISKSTIFFSGNKNGRHEFGTGFVIRNNLVQNILNFKPINERICYIRMKGERYNTSIISAHAPTEEKDEDIKDEFYDALEREIDTMPKHDMRILCGDFNAKIGKEPSLYPTIGKHSLHNISNDNGLRLTETAAANNMLIKSTMFPHKDIHKQTWVSNDHITRNQIDHIIVDARHSNNIIDVRSLRGIDGDTDHYLVRAKVKSRISSHKYNKTTINPQWNMDEIHSAENQRNYREQLEQTLNSEREDKDIEQLWEATAEIITKTADKIFGRSKQKRAKTWYDEECRKQLEKRQTVRKTWIQLQTDQSKKEYDDCRKETRKIIRTKKRNYEQQKYENMERDRPKPGSREFYKAISSEKRGHRTNSIHTLRDNQGRMIIDGREITEEWKKYFRDLLNIIQEEQHKEEIYITADMPVKNPSFEETQRALNKLKNHKAPGTDGIPAELLKYGGDALHRRIHQLITHIWLEERTPARWKENIIVPIHKKGDKTKCANYRGISLLNTAYKTLSNIILSRLIPYAENVLGEYQAGFRANRSTIDQLFTLRQLLEKGWEYNRPIHNLFIDFRQAYDSVERSQVWNAMAEFSIPKKLIRMTKVCMEGGISKVRVNNKLSSSFEINSGLKQGDALSPLLFNLVLEKAMRSAEIKTELLSAQGPKLLLAYADDIDLVGDSTLSTKDIFNKVEGATSKVGLKINEEKTKYMCINRTTRRDRIGQNVTINTFNFERVQRFKYLGAVITADNDVTEEIKNRIQSANRCLFALNKLIKSKNLTRSSKIKIYKSIVRPVITYGCETWTMTKANEEKLRRFERKILRKIFGPHHDITTNQYKIRTNIELKALYNNADIVQEIKSQRLRWAGHVHRLHNERLVKLVWEEIPTGKRPLGRPRMRWKDNIQADLRKMNIPFDPRLMEDRTNWKKVVQSAKTHPGL